MRTFSRAPLLSAGLVPACFLAIGFEATAQSFPNFESPQIAPIEISQDGLRLLTVNTPDARVAVWSLANPRLPTLLQEIPVGLEPVTVRFRTAHEAWVVNHLGDSISVIDLDVGAVIATIQVEDEPSDLRFANGRAFVTSATRREVTVIDPATRTVINRVDLFADEPRWMAVSADGSRLFVASHKSGNDTTVVAESAAPPPPASSVPNAPRTGLIVDSDDPTWTAAHGVVLPDYDVFEIDTSSLAITRRFTDVGTLLFGLAVNPTDGALWVANTDARNLVRFEPALRGHLVDHRVTRITTGGAASVVAYDLNAGVDYSVLPNPAALGTALAQPTDVAFAPNGNELFVAGFGTDRVGVVDPASGNVTAHIEIGDAQSSRDKRGPRGLAHHPSSSTLYVLNRLANSLSIVDTVARSEVRELPLVFDPTPIALKHGRGFLYDTKLSGNGTASCAVCHVDATTDNLGWDLGDPNGATETVTTSAPQLPFPLQFTLHPLKGPMLTQTLVGTASTGPLHWRGDQPGGFTDFNPAFDSLLGGSQLPTADMNAFAAFVDSIVYPPNPNQQLDRTYSTTPGGESAEDGRRFYTQTQFNGNLRCVDCHSLSTGTNGVIIPGQVLQEPQPFKVAQLRNLYKRDGKRPQGGLRKAGFGSLHDGTRDDVFGLLSLPVFGPLANQARNKRMLQRFVEAFDTGTAPTVGYSVSIDTTNRQLPATVANVALLVARAEALDCDLVARGTVGGAARGFAYDRTTDQWVPDRSSDPALTTAQLNAELTATTDALTLIGVPPGHGTRIGVDRDGDGRRDGDEAATIYGNSTAGCAHTIRASSPAFRGNAVFSFVADGATPGSNGAVFLGFGPSAIPFLGIEILVDPATLLVIPLAADARGTAAFALPLSTDPSLAGLALHAQAIFLDGCGTMGLAASHGVRAVID